VTFEKLEEAETECERFLSRVKALRAAYEKQKAVAVKLNREDPSQRCYYGLSYHPLETGAIRRASLDLTRALAKLRRYAE
jgi:hypothetical protein